MSSKDPCQVCKNVAKEPTISSCCTEIFCKKCIELMILNKKCPKCGSKDVSSLGPDTKKPDSFNVSLDENTKCIEDDCTWKGTMDDLDAHLEVCEFAEIECEFCEEDVQRREMGTHLAQCPERKYECPKRCGGTFKRDELNDHITMCGQHKQWTKPKAKVEPSPDKKKPTKPTKEPPQTTVPKDKPAADPKEPTEQTKEPSQAAKPKQEKKKVSIQEPTKEDQPIDTESSVDPASSTVRQICPVCKKKPAEGQVVASGCCREIFCKTCWKDLVQQKKPCPKCKTVDSGRFAKQVSRYTLDLDVSCEEKECPWEGDLSELDAHQKECKFYRIECEWCEEMVQRRNMASHLAKDCPENVVQCPKNCGGSFKRKDLGAHTKECGKLARQVADLKTKQDEQQKSIDGLNKHVQTLDKTVSDNQTRAMAAIETSQQQQQQKQNQLDQELRAQIDKYDKKHQEHQKKGEELQQSIARLEADLKQQQTDQQAAKEQQSAHTSVDGALKAQDDRTKQDIARIDKKQKEISDQQQKHETATTKQQEALSRLENQLQEQTKTSDKTKSDLQKQLDEVKKKQDEQQGKLAEQQNTTTRLSTLLQDEQRKLEAAIAEIERQQPAKDEKQLRGAEPTKGDPLEHDDSVKQDLAKVENQLVDLKQKQADQQVKITEQQSITARLEAQLNERKKVDDSTAQTIATLDTELKAQQLDHQARLKEQETTRERPETLIQQQGDTTTHTLRLAELESEFKKEQAEQNSRLNDHDEKFKQQNVASSKQETLQQEQQRQMDVLKDSITKLEQELGEQRRQHQEKLAEQQISATKLEELLQQQSQKHNDTLTAMDEQKRELQNQHGEQQAKITEQQEVITRLEEQLHEYHQEILARPQQPNIMGALPPPQVDGGQQQDDIREGLKKVKEELDVNNDQVDELRAEIASKERSMWCWISILVVLIALVVILYNNKAFDFECSTRGKMFI